MTSPASALGKQPSFLGRTVFNPNTRIWSFPDGSGKILDEARIEMEIGTGNERGTLPAFDDGTRRRNYFDIKERYSI